MDELIDRIIEEISNDIAGGDTTAIYEMFERLIEVKGTQNILNGYLPEPLDKTIMFTNYYKCTCGTTWELVWDCSCDDRCPACGNTIEPFHIRDYN